MMLLLIGQSRNLTLVPTKWPPKPKDDLVAIMRDLALQARGDALREFECDQEFVDALVRQSPDVMTPEPKERGFFVGHIDGIPVKVVANP